MCTLSPTSPKTSSPTIAPSTPATTIHPAAVAREAWGNSSVLSAAIAGANSPPANTPLMYPTTNAVLPPPYASAAVSAVATVPITIVPRRPSVRAQIATEEQPRETGEGAQRHHERDDDRTDLEHAFAVDEGKPARRSRDHADHEDNDPDGRHARTKAPGHGAETSERAARTAKRWLGNRAQQAGAGRTRARGRGQRASETTPDPAGFQQRWRRVPRQPPHPPTR